MEEASLRTRLVEMMLGMLSHSVQYDETIYGMICTSWRRCALGEGGLPFRYIQPAPLLLFPRNTSDATSLAVPAISSPFTRRLNVSHVDIICGIVLMSPSFRSCRVSYRIWK